MRKIGRYDESDSYRNDRLKNTISNIRNGRIYKDISCKHSINKDKKRTLTDDELDYACKSIANGIDPAEILSNMDRGNLRPVRQAVHDIARGSCHKEKVKYYKTQLEGSTTIP